MFGSNCWNWSLPELCGVTWIEGNCEESGLSYISIANVDLFEGLEIGSAIRASFCGSSWDEAGVSESKKTESFGELGVNGSSVWGKSPD